MAKREEEIKEERPGRVYSDSELRTFHQRIQRFYKPHKIQNPEARDFGETYMIFDYNEFGVAYGAFVKRDGAFGTPHYLSCQDEFGDSTRYKQMNELLRQHDEWVKLQDWKDGKERERLEEMAETVVF